MRTVHLLLLASLSTACTDPFAGDWQSHGPDLAGDFELFLDEDLLGTVVFLYRSEDGNLTRIDKEVEGNRYERKDGVWYYEVLIEGTPDLDCALDRNTDELSCEWGDHELDFKPYEENDAACRHGPCGTGTPLKSSCSPCIASICELDKFCCNNAWDDYCMFQVPFRCPGSTCG